MCHVKVVRREGESSEALIRRFSKRVRREKIIEEVRERIFYEKPSVRRRREKRRRKKVLQTLREK